MLRPELFERFPCWSGAALYLIRKPLTDSFAGICLRGNIEKPLIRLCILDYRFGLPVDGEDNGPLGLAKLPHHLDRVIAKSCERLNVLGDVHRATPSGGSLTYLACPWIQLFSAPEPVRMPQTSLKITL